MLFLPIIGYISYFSLDITEGTLLSAERWATRCLVSYTQHDGRLLFACAIGWDCFILGCFPPPPLTYVSWV